MDKIESIALGIYAGEQNGNLDPFPLVSVGEIPEHFQAVSPSIVKESRVWMITHHQNYTCYSLYSTAWQTAEGVPGQLLISLFLPIGKKLADGKSPLGILDAGMDKFSIYGVRGGQLLNGTVQSTHFATILNGCHLEDCQSVLPVMSGNTPASLCAVSLNQVDELMRYSHYASLRGISRLEIGLRCKTTISLMEEQSEDSADSLEKKTIYQSIDLFENEINENIQGGTSVKKIGGILAAVAVAIGVGYWVFFSGNSAPQEDSTEKMQENELAEEFVVDSVAVEVNEEARTMTMEVAEKENFRTELLALVNKGDLIGCRKHAGWQSVLSARERECVETVLDENRYRKYSAVIRKEIGSLLQKKRYDSWPEVMKMRDEIVRLISTLEEAPNAPEKVKVQTPKKEVPTSRPSTSGVPEWQNEIGKKAKTCPFSLRLGVQVTSISYNMSSVTCTLVYEEMSKYNITEYALEQMRSDEEKIKKEHLSGLPSSVRVNFIKKDKADRIM